MKRDQLQKFVLAHQGFASALQGHLERLWQRELTTGEVHTVRSYTLCGSFMSLESIDRGLSLAGTAEKATSYFSFMASEVNEHSEKVVQEVRRSLGLGAEAPDQLAFPDLLSWEEAALLWRQRAGAIDRATRVAAALARVATLRAAEFEGDDLAVCELLAEYGESNDLAERLWVDLPEVYRPQDVADLFSLWAWRTNDNGAAIMRTLESWVLECADETKVWVALHQDAYPFIDHGSRIKHLGEVAMRFPVLASRCAEMIAQTQAWLRRDAQPPKPRWQFWQS